MRNQFYYGLLFLSSILLAGGLAGCKQDFDKDGDGVPGKKDKCPTIAANTPDGCPDEVKHIQSIHFYLETSASMAGYFQGQRFKEIISDLVSKVDKEVPHDGDMDIWFTAEKSTKFNGTPQDFSGAIARTEIEKQKSSQLHTILKNIAGKNKAGDISLLVSDCILSFPDADIRSNPEINRQNASTALKNDVYATFSDLRKKGFGASIYAFRSDFKGTYYTYQNKPLPLQASDRPFYVWVIGDTALLRRFDAELSDISTFRPEAEMHFGLSSATVTRYDIIPQLRNRSTASWMKEDNGVKELSLNPDREGEIPLAVNLSDLPPYVQKPPYLNEHLQLETSGCTASISAMTTADADRSNLRSEPQKKLVEAATHILMLHISAMNLSSATVTITLPMEAPTWHTQWSCMDDRDQKADCAKKTFAFEYLIQGVQEAYRDKSGAYLRLHVDVKK